MKPLGPSSSTELRISSPARELADSAILLMLAPIGEHQRRSEHALGRSAARVAHGIHLAPPRWRPVLEAVTADRAQWAVNRIRLPQVGINVGANAMVADLSGWPKNPRALAGRLRRAQTFLRTLGIEIVFGREGRLGTRTIRITAIDENQSHNTVSTVSTVSDNGHGAGLNHPPAGLEQAL